MATQHMKSYLLSIASVVLVSIASALAQEEWSICTAFFDGVKYDFRVPASVAQKTPSWDPGKADAPLSISAAATRALDWARKQPGKFDAIIVDRIEARRFQVWTSNASGGTVLCDKWYYRVDYYLYLDGHAIYSASRPVAVLMDGSIVPPKVEKKQ